jgi:hypothetical protein
MRKVLSSQRPARRRVPIYGFQAAKSASDLCGICFGPRLKSPHSRACNDAQVLIKWICNMAREPRNDSDWRPWGLDDYECVRDIPEETFAAVARCLKGIDEAHRIDLRERLKGLATNYWRRKRDIEQPSPKWYRKQIQPIQKATDNLLEALRRPPKGITGRAALVRLTRLRMRRSLRGPDPDSIEEILAHFSRVCAESLRIKGSAGARRQSHLQNAVQELATIWKEVVGQPLSLSLDTEIGRGEEFVYPGPRFAQIVLQGIDPRLSISEIATALRNALGGRRVQKSTKR